MRAFIPICFLVKGAELWWLGCYVELLISRGEEFQIFKLMCKSHRVKAPVEAS